MFKKIALLSLFMALFVHTQVWADTVRLNKDSPERYVVVKGDTLWDISGTFLKDPWLWPEIWHINEYIDNPHLIFPGDVISMVYIDGKLRLTVERASNVVKLSPEMRISSIETAIPTIPLDVIQQFLSFPQVISENELEHSAYVVASEDGRLMSATDDKVYVRKLQDTGEEYISIYHPGAVYRNEGADKDDVLGYEVKHVADARIEAMGDPATLLITESTREVMVGDRLLPYNPGLGFNPRFVPHAMDKKMEGQIISVLDEVTRIGQFHTVVLNKGLGAGVETGHVFAVYQAGEVIKDKIKSGWRNKVKLPDVRAGTIMVVLPFENVSYALVMEATRDIHIYDAIRNP